jgi:peptide/nickel transport system ATP-binding protein
MAELRKVRARSLGVIFQDARLAVDPLWTIEDHVTEGMRVHAGLTRVQARAKAIGLLRQVGIRDADRRDRDSAWDR